MKGIFEVEAIRGEVLGIQVFRGFARLSDLARISQPDIYDQEKNPMGTQRDLNRRHAREAYEYVKTHSLAFYPEIVLHARDESLLQFTPVSKSLPNVGKLRVNLDRTPEAGEVILSRVDGNHRLHYADGHDPGFPPLDKLAGFCIMHDLPLSEAGVSRGELLVFRDINANQQGMNTSHLDSIDLRTAERGLEARDPVLYIAEKLMDDEDSPFRGRVYRGGVKPGAFMLPLRNVKTSVQYMHQRSKKLGQFSPDAQATLIKRYWEAVRRWVPDAWENPRKYIALRATGFWAMSFIGSDVIDLVVRSAKLDATDMFAVLESGKEWDWTNSGDFRGYGGRAGAVQIANMVTREFASEGPSISAIEKRLRE